MRKLRLFIMPLVAVFLLASCSSSPTPVEDITHKFIFNGTYCTINGDSEYSHDIFEKDKNVKYTIVPLEGYKLPETIDSDISYNPTSGVITIDEMKTDITLNVTADPLPPLPEVTHTIHLDPSGGTFEDGQLEIIDNIVDGDTIIEAPKIKRDGYKSSEVTWWTEPNGKGNQFKFGSKDIGTIVKGNYFLHAKWGSINTYTVHFKDKDDESTISVDQTINYNEKVQRPVIPTKLGYNFDDWYINQQLTGKYNFDTRLTDDNYDITIWGNFTLSDKYHAITFHNNDGSTTPVVQIVEHGKLATEPKDPTKIDYIFVGWYTTATFDEGTQFSFDTKIEKNYDLYARWEGEFEYHVALTGDDKLILEKDAGFFVDGDYVSRIYLKDAYKGKYEIPIVNDYYEVTVNSEPLNNFTIEKISYGVDPDYYVNITIPKEELGSNIVIKTASYCHYLTFTGVEDNAIIYHTYKTDGEPITFPELYYTFSLDTPDWKVWNSGEENKFTLEKDQTIYVKNLKNVLSYSFYNHLNFSTGPDGSYKVACGGNIMSLLNFGDLTNGCFHSLFDGCFSLTSAPVLPALTLTKECYEYMFRSCKSLLFCPVLPATTLAEYCYDSLFEFCSSLTAAPKLPAIEMAGSCYQYMFSDCVNLTIPPYLPGKNLKKRSYYRMFDGCSKLKINNEGYGTNFFICPTIGDESVNLMFAGTGGDYTENPVEGGHYYYTLN